MINGQWSTIFYDVGHYVLDVQSGSTYLLGDEAGGGHAGRGVYFQEVDFGAFGDDVIHADDASGTQDVVDGGSQLLHPVAQLIGDTGGSNFVRITLVLGVIVEILVVRDDFGDGEGKTTLLLLDL